MTFKHLTALSSTVIRTMLVPLAAIIIMLAACSTEPTDPDPEVAAALKQAGPNRTELMKVLDHYRNHPEKLAAARWLIAKMRGRYSYRGSELDSIESLYRSLQQKELNFSFDSAQIAPWKRFSLMKLRRQSSLITARADYLIDNIDRAYAMWKERPWNQRLPFNDFCELLLPYGIGDERFSDWRQAYYDKYGTVLDSVYHGNDAVEAARILIELFNSEFWCYNEELITPHRDAMSLLESRTGYNRDICDKLLYIMRACGVPAAIDQLLVQSTRADAHMWLVVRDNITGRYLPCGVDSTMPDRDNPAYIDRTKGKVYRLRFGRDPEQARNIRDIHSLPVRYNNPYMSDVTWEYFGHDSIIVPVSAHAGKPVYLGLWATRQWYPIGIGEPAGAGYVKFRDVEPGSLLAPVVATDNTFAPCGDAFYLDLTQQPVILRPDSTMVQRVELQRTMSIIGVHLARMSSDVIGSRIEISATPDFHSAVTLGVVTDTIRSPHLTFDVPDEYSSWHYLRFYAPPGHRAALNELTAFADDSMSRPFNSYLIDRVTYPFQPEMLTDRNPNTTYTAPPGHNAVTINMGNGHHPVRKIKFVPRVDRNFVREGQEYELFYFDGNPVSAPIAGLDTTPRNPADTTRDTRDMALLGWKSLGTRRAGHDETVRFVTPANTMLMLQSTDSTQQGQCFIWHDGQVFASDITRPLQHRRRPK